MPMLFSKFGVGNTHVLSTESYNILPANSSMDDFDNINDNAPFDSSSSSRFFNIDGYRLGFSFGLPRSMSPVSIVGFGSSAYWFSLRPMQPSSAGVLKTIFQELPSPIGLVMSTFGWDPTNRFFIMEIESNSESPIPSVDWSFNSGIGGGTFNHGSVTKSFTLSGDSFTISTQWFGASLNGGTTTNPMVTITMVKRNGSIEGAASTSNSYDQYTWSSGSSTGGFTLYLHWGTATVDDTQNWIIADLVKGNSLADHPRKSGLDRLTEEKNYKSNYGYSCNAESIVASMQVGNTDNDYNFKKCSLIVSQTESFKKDVAFGGSGTINGTVYVEGVPAANKVVMLYSSWENIALGKTISDSNGNYQFNNLRVGVEHFVVAFDPSDTYNAVIQDRVLVIPT